MDGWTDPVDRWRPWAKITWRRSTKLFNGPSPLKKASPALKKLPSLGPKSERRKARMKILGIVASPRKGGNTDVLVDRVLEGAKTKGAEVEKLYLRDWAIQPCQGAFSCEIAQQCILPDEMQKIYPRLHEAAGIVIGTPIYMSGVSGPLVNFLDRCRPFISYMDSLGILRMSPAEKKALLQEAACLHLWKDQKTYAEIGSRVEEVMESVIHSYTKEHETHPRPARRLAGGKRGAVILSYHQRGKTVYQRAIDYLLFNLEYVWELKITDILTADRILKRGDAQKRDDLMQAALEAGIHLVKGT
jgi:hypothetical protein